MSKREYPEWMDEPLELWDDNALHLFLKTPKHTPPIPSLDDFIRWVETYHGEAQTFLYTLKYWRNKHLEETL